MVFLSAARIFALGTATTVSRGWKSGCRFQDFNLVLENFQLGAKLRSHEPGYWGRNQEGIGILLLEQEVIVNRSLSYPCALPHSGFAIGVDGSQGPFRGFLPRKTTPRDLYQAQ